MSFTERVQVVIDVAADKGMSFVQQFRTEVAKADTVTGKFKAGASAAFDGIKAKAGQLAMAGGAALLAFGIKALAAFEKSAKAAVDFGKKTGLATEDASRWIAVADDFEVSADQLATAMGRLGKNMDSAAMAKYGIATRDTAGHARTANDVFLDVLDVLNNTAPAERARVGAELLGKGWQAVAPMLGHTRAEYEEMLSTVDEGQVITEKEAAKAERMRLAQDALKDALNRVTLAVGEFVAGMAPQIESLTQVVEFVSDVNDEYGEYIDAAKTIVDIGNPFGWMGAADILESATALDIEGESLNTLKDAIREAGSDIEYATPLIQRWIDAHQDAGVKLEDVQIELFGTTLAIEGAGDAAGTAAPEVQEFIDAFADARDRASDVGELSDEFAGLLGLLDVEDAAEKVATAFDDVTEAATEAWDASVTGAEDADKKQREYQGSVRDLKRDVIAFGEQVKGLPKERITKILTAIDQGSIAEARALFAELQADVTKTVTVYVNGKFSDNLSKISGSLTGTRAIGGPVNTPGPYLVGEQGPEVLDLPAGANVHPASATPALNGASIVDRSTHHYYLPAQTPESLVVEASKYRLRNARSS